MSIGYFFFGFCGPLLQTVFVIANKVKKCTQRVKKYIFTANTNFLLFLNAFMYGKCQGSIAEQHCTVHVLTCTIRI